ncbi:MAG: phosphoglycerate dehydrogenase [Solirubrobacteraceae bacterium]
MQSASRAPDGYNGLGQVLVTWPDYDPDGLRAGKALSDAGLTALLAPKVGARTTAQVRRLAADAVAAIVSTDPFDAMVLDACPHLRVIARVGVGVDSIDLHAATARGVAVTITPGANEVTVADHTIALMLAVLRRVCEHDRGVRNGSWNRTGQHAPWTLTGATVGLVGFGRIGRLVAERLAGFGVRLLATDPVTPTGHGVEAVELPELLRRSGVVSIHTPLTPVTHGLIDADALRQMQSHTVLVNTSRGGIVDEHALLRELTTGGLRGAALDVFASEPPHGSPLLELPNVVASPHNAGLSADSIEHMVRRATASVLDALAGRLPQDLANPEIANHPWFTGGGVGGAVDKRSVGQVRGR